MRWGIIAGEFLIHDRRKFAQRAFFCFLCKKMSSLQSNVCNYKKTHITPAQNKRGYIILETLIKRGRCVSRQMYVKNRL